MKSDVYQALHLMNQASAATVVQIENLRNEGLLKPDFAELRILAVRQNAAEINTSVAHRLAQLELELASRLEKTRLKKERALAEK